MWVPAVVLLLCVGPRLWFLLPSPREPFGEVYQPMRAIAFGQKLGQDFHKYGPVPNFILLPGFGVTFAWWWLTGTFSSPSNDWPFGLTDPVGQLGTLVFQQRTIGLLLAAGAVAWLAGGLMRMTGSKLAAMVTTLLVVVSNYHFAWDAGIASPDGFMLSFLLIALGAAARLIGNGPSRALGVTLGVAAALSFGCKENSGPILIGLCLVLIPLVGLRHGFDVGLRRSIVAAIVAGIGCYLLTSVIYAPGIWWQRMDHWLFEGGLDSGIWGTWDSERQHVWAVVRSLTNNLGPTGVVLVPFLLIAGVLRRPTETSLLIIPGLIGLVVAYLISYTPDRFFTGGCVALSLPVAVGLSHLLNVTPRRGRPALISLLLASITFSVWWSLITYHLANVNEQATVEHFALQTDPQATKGYAIIYNNYPLLKRLAWLGHDIDLRSITHLGGEDRPELLYGSAGRVSMYDEAVTMPARAELYAREGDFDASIWKGIEALGYAPPERLRRKLPTWLPFGWMPLMRELRHEDLLLYRRVELQPDSETADVATSRPID